MRNVVPSLSLAVVLLIPARARAENDGCGIATLSPPDGLSNVEANVRPLAHLTAVRDATACPKPQFTLTTEGGAAVPFTLTEDPQNLDVKEYHLQPTSALTAGAYVFAVNLPAPTMCATTSQARTRFVVGPRPTVSRITPNFTTIRNDGVLNGVQVGLSENVAKKDDLLPAAKIVTIERVGGERYDVDCSATVSSVTCKGTTPVRPGDGATIRVTVSKSLAFQSHASMSKDFTLDVPLDQYLVGWTESDVKCSYEPPKGLGCAVGGRGTGGGATVVLLGLLLAAGLFRRRRGGGRRGLPPSGG